MCLGIPVQVVGPGAHDDVILIRAGEEDRSVNRMMIEGPLEPGEWLVLHLGFAMERISETDAKDALALLRTLGGVEDDGTDPDSCRDDPAQLGNDSPPPSAGSA